MKKKAYDVVVFGATSFVGQILCRYLLGEFGTAATALGAALQSRLAAHAGLTFEVLA